MSRFPPRRILVAFDLSDASRVAWRHAAALAARCSAELEAVYVEPWEVGVDLLPPPGLDSRRIRELRAKIRTVVRADAKITVLQGDPAMRVLELAGRRRADLVVVGTHGRKGLKRALLGSVAEAVVRGARVPVLVARGPVRPVRSILAPVNFARYSETGFAYAAAVSAALAARMTALHVTDDPIWSGNPSFRLRHMVSRLAPEVRAGCRPEVRSVLGEAVEGILKAATGHDWIVLVSHEKRPVLDALFGTTFERVLRDSRVPVVALPAPCRSSFALRSEAGLPAARYGQ